MSCSCNNSYYNLPCCCPPVPVGPTTTTTTTVCPDAIPCEEAYQSDCIIYNGPDITCYGIKTGDSVTDIINIIIAQLNPCTTTTTSTTSTTTAGPTTTSSTTTSSTTTTTTEVPITSTTSSTTTTTIAPSGIFEIQNNTTAGTISAFTIGGGYITSSGSIPLTTGGILSGSHPDYPLGTLGDITIDAVGSISIYKNGVVIECIDVPSAPGIFTISFGPLAQAYLTTDDFLITYDDTSCPTTSTTSTTSTSTTTSTTTVTPTTSTTTSGPTTTSTTATPTTTSTTTGAPTNKSLILVDNFTGSSSITNIVINSTTQLPLLQNYPIGPFNGSNGQYNSGVIDVTISLSGIPSGTVITLTDSLNTTQCIALTTGQTSVTFTGKLLDDNVGGGTNFAIVLKPGPC